MPRSISMYGRETCEDTILARDRLRRYGVAVTAFDVEADHEAARRVEAWNGGNRVTPTFDIEGRIVAEPSLDRLDDLLRDAGYDIRSPSLRAPASEPGTGRPSALPERVIATTAGAILEPDALLGRRQALFFAHGPDCLACRGYARALVATVQPSFAVLSAGPAVAERWLHGEAELPADRVLVDENGAWRTALEGRGGVRHGDAFVALVDADGSIELVSDADEAGGLVAAAVAGEWVRSAENSAANP